MERENRESAKILLRRMAASVLLLCLTASAVRMGKNPADAGTGAAAREEAPDWRTILGGLGYAWTEKAPSGGEKPEDGPELFARAAALIDADSGRLLYGKDETAEYPMASTTKVMTCVVALECGNPDDEVTVTARAAGQPEVRLGIREGEKYRLGDLLYAMMLTSYNDCAVAVAEHIGGSVEEFAAMMNRKARDLGCYSTWYVTPNGLDGEDEGGVHRTSAVDLARVLAYAVRNETFLEITRTPSYSFCDCSGKRSFTAQNKNAFLTMMDGVITGKTGYTGDAGYCYVGALSRGGRTFVAAVLGSGWPPQKTRKWSDMKALMNYGLQNYAPFTVGEDGLVTEVRIPVENGVSGGVKASLRWSGRTLLAREGETVRVSAEIPRVLTAPVWQGAIAGHLTLYLEDEPVALIPAVLEESVAEFTLEFCIEHIFAEFFDIFPEL